MTVPFRYDGKRVVITGAYSGMGAETVKMLAEAGAEIHALDIKEVTGRVARFIQTDVGDPAAIDAAIAQIGAPIHCLFNCAGIPQTFPPIEVMKVNLLGLRHLTERVLPLMPEGGAVAHVASIAGSQWPQRLEIIKELLATPDFAAGQEWCENHLEQISDGYGFSKECVTVYGMMRAKSVVQQSIRINCLSPGLVETPMMPAFRQTTGPKVLDWTASQGNGRLARAEEMAPPLIFLNSDEASYVNGANLFVDGGFTGALGTGVVDFSGLAD
jgi:NAD(P)-dependent dehydrogenase (short-subunit alcohol dehydrogenase family)